MTTAQTNTVNEIKAKIVDERLSKNPPSHIDNDYDLMEYRIKCINQNVGIEIDNDGRDILIDDTVGKKRYIIDECGNIERVTNIPGIFDNISFTGIMIFVWGFLAIICCVLDSKIDVDTDFFAYAFFGTIIAGIINLILHRIFW